MKPNLILLTDSYKIAHQVPNVYPAGIINLHSYGEARVPADKKIVFLGLQGFIRAYLMNPITYEDIEEAERVLRLHGLELNSSMWNKIVKVYNGYLPLRITALPEGSVVGGGTPLWTVELSNPDPELVALPSTIETALQRAIWYPSTVASKNYELYRYLKQAYDYASDNPDVMAFSYHDFGSRGVSSDESSMIGGLAHLVYFQGTDNLSALRYARKYYHPSAVDAREDFMPGYSVPATEHSIQCSFGSTLLDQKSYILNSIRTLGKKGGICSVVLDGFDFERELATVCHSDIVEEVRNIGVKLVLRPDSGDPVELLPSIFSALETAYGTTVNSKGFKVLRDVGVIWGDGIDQSLAMYLYSKCILDSGFAPENLVLGSGGALLQKVNRDTFRFAQKTSAVQYPDGTWVPVQKAPKTDVSKKSKAGKQITENMQVFYDVYPYGHLFESLDSIRYRAKQEA